MELRRGISEQVFRVGHSSGEALWRVRSKYCVAMVTVVTVWTYKCALCGLQDLGLSGSLLGRFWVPSTARHRGWGWSVDA